MNTRSMTRPLPPSDGFSLVELMISLAIFGIVIGVAAVIVMVTVGNGATVQVGNDIAAMGSDRLTIAPGQALGPGRTSAGAELFTAADADARGIFGIGQLVGVEGVAAAVAATAAADPHAVADEEGMLVIDARDPWTPIRGGRWSSRAVQHVALIDRLAVVIESEVLAPETSDSLTVRSGGHDLDVDDVDLDRFHEDRRLDRRQPRVVR